MRSDSGHKRSSTGKRKTKKQRTSKTKRTPRFQRDLWHRDKEDLTKELESWLAENHYNPSASGLAESFLQDRSDLFQGNNHSQQHVVWIEVLLRKTKTAPRRRGRAAPDTDNMATRLLVWAEDEGVYLFGSDGEGFVRLSTDGRREIWPVSSQQFERFLTKLLFDHEGKPPGKSVLENTTRLANALAIFERPQHELHNRVAWHDGALWYDLCNQAGEAVKVTEEGWEITKPPILFRRYKHQKQAVKPILVEDADAEATLEKFLDIVNHDPNTRLLHKVQIVFSFIPDVPHPISNLHGVQGSAKTCYCELWLMLVDPSIISTHVLPRKQDELMQCLDHHWMTVFDNISDLSDWQSDALCRAVTGAGLQKRVIYTVDDDHFYTFKRVIVLNGINIAAIRPDLLDRSILHEFPSIPVESRITVEELWEKFDCIAPEIMGTIFTVLSKAMKILPTMKASGLYRMADFTKWGIAIAEAIGYEGQDFIDEYSRNLKGANLQAIESSTVGTVLLELMVEYIAAGRYYVDSPRNVLKQLEEVAGSRVASADWPTNAQTLGRILTNLKTNLERQGIEFTRGRGHDRNWTFVPIETAGQLTLEFYSSDEEARKEGHENDQSANSDASDANTQIPNTSSEQSQSEDDNDKEASDASQSSQFAGCDVLSQLRAYKVQPPLNTFQKRDKKDIDRTTSSANCDASDIPTQKTLPRTVKQFEKWLKPLPSAGQRGFKESDIKRAHDERYLDGISKYEKKGWIEQRKDSKIWWLSDAGKAALRGDA